MRRYAAALSVCIGLALSSTVFAQARKADVCHAIGNGAFKNLSISLNAVSAHRAHGDALPGEGVPGRPGYAFDANCAAVLAQPDFFAFYIRNNSGTTQAPWDADMTIAENTEGDGFSALTPRSGQKVGYGTNFFDGVPVNSLESTDWDKVSGAANPAYLNIWVTDGVNYAVIASENDYRGTDFQTRTEWKVFETDTNNLGWLCSTGPATKVSQYLLCNGVNATLASIPANVTIMSPPGFPWPHVGTGAPRGGYGFNLIYGDTASNFLGSYQLNNLSITVGGITYFAQ